MTVLNSLKLKTSRKLIFFLYQLLPVFPSNSSVQNCGIELHFKFFSYLIFSKIISLFSLQDDSMQEVTSIKTLGPSAFPALTKNFEKI